MNARQHSVKRAIAVWLRLLTLAVLVGAAPDSLAAQGLLTGVVTDSAGAPILSARVTIDSTYLVTSTDASGRFRIVNAPLGRHNVTVLRLGFEKFRAPVEIQNGVQGEMKVRMIPIVATLPKVVVNPAHTKYSGRLAGYYSRLEKKSSGAYFITRADIDKNNPSTMGRLLSTIPAVQPIKGRGGITGIRMRGRRCWPLVWIDGNPMPAGEVDLDAFVPSSIQGIELYLGTSTVPMAYVMNQSLSSCGTILLWSRGPDTDPVRSMPRAWQDLEDMIARNSVFTAKNVDRAARLDSTQVLNLVFPPSLFASHTPGLVIAEFVVNANGKVEDNTIGVVSSTSPLFTESVRAALVSATFIPAIKDGKAVRQLVQQPFEFSLERAGGREASAR